MAISRIYVTISTYYEIDIEGKNDDENVDAAYKLSPEKLRELGREGDTEITWVSTDDWVSKELASWGDWKADITAEEILRQYKELNPHE